MTSRVFVVASVLAGTALGAIHPLVLAAWRRGDVDDSSDSDGDDDGIDSDALVGEQAGGASRAGDHAEGAARAQVAGAVSNSEGDGEDRSPLPAAGTADQNMEVWWFVCVCVCLCFPV